MKILLLESDAGIRDYLGMIIEVGFESELLEASSLQEAKNILLADSEVRLVIGEVDIEGGGVKSLLQYLQTEDWSLPIICLTSLPLTHPDVQEIINASEYNGYSPKPFKDTELFPVVEKALNAPIGAPATLVNKNTTQSENQSVPSSVKPQSQKADWNINSESKNAGEQEADWDLNGPKKNSQEVEADWDLNGPKKNSQEVEADWDLNGERKNAGEQEADWDLNGERKNAGEQEADWDLNGERKNAGEQEADWDLNGERKNAGEQEADWEIKQKKKVQYRDPREKRAASSNEGDNDEHPDYFKVKIKRFLNFNNLPCHVFIRLGKDKFVKIVEKDDLYDKQTITKYIDRKVTHLYVQRDQYDDFNKAFSEIILSALQGKNIKEEHRAVGELAAYDHILGQAQKVGISDSVAQQAKQVVETSIAKMKSDKGFASIIEKIMRNQNIISERSLLLSYICQNICMKTSWNSQATLEKLTMASMFHDASLLDHEHLATIESKDSSEFKALSKEEKEIFLNHPAASAQMLLSSKEVYADVDNIISQHHELPDKQGFPRGLSALQISPLSCIFIISQAYMYRSIEPNITQEQLKEAYHEIEERFNRGNFKKPLETFKKAFKSVVK